jgi:hypothetical protein
LVGARAIVDLTQSILLVVLLKVQFALAAPKTTVTERIRVIGRRAKRSSVQGRPPHSRD